MNTTLHSSPIYGPVHSRRLGLSLGINLMPGDGKICNFDCIYCECGYNADRRTRTPRPTREEVRDALHARLTAMVQSGHTPDVITFAGNGEPTAHPHFADIISDTIILRDQWAPRAQISVLSNATLLHRPEVRSALRRVDHNILKLDTVNNAYIHRVNCPTNTVFNVEDIICLIKGFNGQCVIQTMFMKGPNVDNTTDFYVQPWLQALSEIRPKSVMIYTIDRTTPDPSLLKASPEELNRIKNQVISLGIPCTTSY